MPAEIERCAPGSAEIRLRGRRIGWAGRVHPDEMAALEIDAPVFAGEADLTEVIASGPRRPAQAPVSRFPKMVRDVSVLVDRNRTLGDIVNAVTAFRESQGADADLVESFELIDRYLGAGVPEGRVSLTFSVTYRRLDRTLTQDEVDARHQALVGVLAKEVGATLRS